jgi:hypothetical protein
VKVKKEIPIGKTIFSESTRFNPINLRKLLVFSIKKLAYLKYPNASKFIRIANININL